MNHFLRLFCNYVPIPTSSAITVPTVTLRILHVHQRLKRSYVWRRETTNNLPSGKTRPERFKGELLPCDDDSFTKQSVAISADLFFHILSVRFLSFFLFTMVLLWWASKLERSKDDKVQNAFGEIPLKSVAVDVSKQ